MQCPFHGKVIPRDEQGNPTDPEDIERLKKEAEIADRDKVPEWQDPKLLKELKVAVVINSYKNLVIDALCIYDVAMVVVMLGKNRHRPHYPSSKEGREEFFREVPEPHGHQEGRQGNSTEQAGKENI